MRLDSPSLPVRRHKLYEEVASRIEQMIVSGGYAAGQPIPAEREIMEQFGVGRSTVREAMMSLERMGLVTIRSGERARVAKPTAGVLIRELAGAARLLLAQDKGIEQFQDARLLLEVGTARLAALRATSSDISVLEAALEANRRALREPLEFMRTDVAFHYAIASATGNPIFTSLHDGVVEWLTEQRQTSLRAPNSARHAYAAHERIFRAIKARDPAEAQAAMQEHLDQVVSLYWRANRSRAKAKPESAGS